MYHLVLDDGYLSKVGASKKDGASKKMAHIMIQMDLQSSLL